MRKVGAAVRYKHPTGWIDGLMLKVYDDKDVLDILYIDPVSERIEIAEGVFRRGCKENASESEWDYAFL